MAGIEIHECPRCELRFVNRTELEEHLATDHDVMFGSIPAEAPAPPPTVRGRVTVPVDPACPPSPAVATAAALARQCGFEVELVAVVPPGLPPATTDAYLQQRRHDAEAAGAPLVTTTGLGSGDVGPLLLDHVGRTAPTLVCMATRCRRAPGELLFGSVSESVIRRSPVPVLLVGPDAAPFERIDHVVAAVDGSVTAEAASRAAVHLAEWSGADLLLVEVVEPGALDLESLAGESGYLYHHARRLGPIASWDTLHNHHPAAAIVDRARDLANTMVTMGTRGRSGLGLLAAGSVALAVVRHAPGPVLVVPPTAVAAPLAAAGMASSH